MLIFFVNFPKVTSETKSNIKWVLNKTALNLKELKLMDAFW